MKNKKIIFIFIVLLVIYMITADSFVYKVKAIGNHYTMYNIIADKTTFSNNEIEVNYVLNDNEKTITIPNFRYYDFKPDIYAGRIKQATIEEQSSGLMMVKYIISAKSIDLPPFVSNVLSGNVLEVHIYDDITQTLICIYTESSQEIDEYIQNNNVDFTETERMYYEEKLGYITSFLEYKPIVYDINGDMIDLYNIDIEPDVMLLSASTDINTSFPCDPGMFDSYTDCDNFKNDPSKLLSNYQYGSNLGDIYNNIPMTNDDIVQLIPIELFRHRGQYVYIGKEYGFFVNTRVNPDLGGNNNVVDAGIFDVVYTDGVPFNNGANIETKIEIEFLFHHTYQYIEREEFNWDDIDNNLEEVVCPSRLEGTNVYYIHNVSFASLLYDEYKLNQGQASYDVSNDTSAYFNQIRYNFYGSSLEQPDIVGSGISSVKWALGKAENIPGIVGIVGNVASKVWDVVDFIINFENPFSEQYFNHVMSNEINIVSPKPSEDYCRALGLIIEESPESSNVALLKTGQSVEAIYQIGNYYDNYTRIYHTSNVTVSRLDKGALGISRDLVYVANNGSTYYRNIEDKELPAKELEFETETQTVILQNGVNRYEIEPKYSGEYVLSANCVDNLRVTIRNSNKDIIENFSGSKKYSYFFEEGNKYYVDVSLDSPENTEVFNFQIGLKNIMIDVENNVNVLGNSNYAFEFSVDTPSIYKLIAENQDIIVHVLEFNVLNQNLQMNSLKYFRFLPGIKYYIILKNTSSVDIVTSFTIQNVESLSLNCMTEFTVYKGTNYVSYNNNTDSTQEIVFTLSDLLQNEYTWEFRDLSWSIVAATIYSDTGVARITVAANSIIYVGIINENDEINVSIYPTLAEHSFKWFVDGNPLEGDSLYLKRGESVEIKLKVGNIFIEDIDCNTNPIFEIRDSILTVKNTAQLGLSYTCNARGITEYALKIYPQYEKSFDFNIVNSDSLYINWSGFSHVYKANFTLLSPDGTYSKILENVGSYTSSSGRINLNYQTGTNPYNYINEIRSMGYTGWSQCRIRLNWIEIWGNTESGGIWTHKLMNGSNELNVNEKSFDPLFGGGIGYIDDPHLISNVRHLNNIRYRITSYNNGYDISNRIGGHYLLTNDIALSLGANWIPIETPFYGTIEGNYNNIENLTITIPTTIFEETKYINYGLFEFIYGTIQRLNMSNVQIHGEVQHSGGWVNVGAYCGTLCGDIENCYVNSGDIIVHRRFSRIGSITGNIQGPAKVLNCVNYCHVMSNGELGGIAGILNFNAKIENCINYGLVEFYCVEVNEYNNVGGIVGRVISGAEVLECTNLGTVRYTREQWENESLAPCMGQIIGYLDTDSLQENNLANGTLDTGELYSFTTGALWWKETHNQLRNCNSIVGYTEME